MRAFERNLITEWRRLELPTSGATVVIAVSGGADSLSLLLAIDELRRSAKLELHVVAAHYNHLLRGAESESDESFVRDLCLDRRIELSIGSSTVRHQSNIEQAARVDRYKFLRKTADNLRASFVLTAHTVDDQAETLLLNLIRGSGLQGLAGMTPIRPIGTSSEISLVRPLLGWARRLATENYCHELGVEYRSDTMNEDEAFTRVRIRKILLPLLQDFNPKIVDRLADTARLLRQEIEPAVEVTADTLRLADLKDLHDVEFGSIVRAWLTAKRGNLRQIELKHIDAIRRLVSSRKSGKTIELPGGQTVSKEAGELVFSKNLVEKRGSDI